MTHAEATRDFLAQRRIAVVGVSRRDRDFSRHILRKLASGNREVVPVNPEAKVIEGVPCYPDLRAIPNGVDAVLAVTPPDAAVSIVRECVKLGITRVWLHRNFGRGSYSPEAVAEAKAANVTLISAGCPMMFCEPVDLAHKCVRWCLQVTGRLK